MKVAGETPPWWGAEGARSYGFKLSGKRIAAGQNCEDDLVSSFYGVQPENDTA